MKIALAGGGTGGHVYPALAIADAISHELSQCQERAEIVYLGTPGGVEEELVGRAGLPFVAVPAEPLRGRSPLGAARGLTSLGIGIVRAYRVLRDLQPQVLLATGGYASVPTALAARWRRVPLLVYLPDIKPGWAVRLLARLAQRVALTCHPSLRYLPTGKATVTGYPVRREFFQACRQGGRRRLGLDPQAPTLLVSGATRGAHSLNRAVADSLQTLLELCQLIHISGRTDAPWLGQLHQELPPKLQGRYHLYDYLHQEMPWAMAAADLAVLRAGASVLGELPALALPAVLVPYPYAGAHQRHNARYLAAAGAAVILEDNQLHQLVPLLRELLADEKRRQRMAQASRRLAQPDAARSIARLLIEATGRPAQS